MSLLAEWVMVLIYDHVMCSGSAVCNSNQKFRLILEYVIISIVITRDLKIKTCCSLKQNN